GPLSEAATAEVCGRVEEAIRTSDGLIVLDQLVDEDCGVVNSTVRGTIEELARREPGKLVFVDSRRFLGRFAAGVLKGNRAEVQLASEEQDPARGLRRLSEKTGRLAFCTAGESGII